MNIIDISSRVLKFDSSSVLFARCKLLHQLDPLTHVRRDVQICVSASQLHDSDAESGNTFDILTRKTSSC